MACQYDSADPAHNASKPRIQEQSPVFAADGWEVAVKEFVPLNEAQSTHGDLSWMKDFCRP